MFNIILDVGATLRRVNTAESKVDAWEKMAKHTMALIIGEDRVMFRTRTLTDGYAIVDSVGEEIGRITMELNQAVNNNGFSWR